MNIALILIGVIVLGKLLEKGASPVSISAQATGAPVLNRMFLPPSVPISTPQPITEAAYHVYPTMAYIPSSGSTVDDVNLPIAIDVYRRKAIIDNVEPVIKEGMQLA